jgi:hypothetical protein
LTGRNALRGFLVTSDFLQEQSRPHAKRAGQGDQSFQTRRHMAGLEPAQHTGTDAGRGCDIRQRQALSLSDTSRDGAQLPPNIRRRGRGVDAAGRTGACHRLLGKTRHGSSF